MSNRALARVLALPLVMLTGLGACQTPVAATQMAPSDAQALVEDVVDHAPLFSGVALISRHGQVVGLAVRGEADRSTHMANRPQTLFSIASAGKMVTAEAIDVLVRSGVLSFDTPVARVLPDLAPAIADGVTVDALLQHRSGLTVANEPSDEALEQVASSHDLFALYAGLGLSSNGPAPFRYDNANYILLGEIVERLSGQSYEAFVRDKVLAPQGLDSPLFLRTDAEDDLPIARPYMPVDYETWWNSDGGLHGNSAADYVHLAPAATPSAGGGALASGPDMARFIARFAEGEWADDLCGIVTATAESGYGRGCSVNHAAYGRRYGHTGSTAGVQARIFAYPDRGFEIVVLSNHDEEAAPVFDALEARLFGQGDALGEQ